MDVKVSLEELIELVKSTKELILGQDVTHDYTAKGKADYVTRVDIAVQSYLQEKLLKMHPEIKFLGEESSDNNVDLAFPTWILDPIDGTTNLIHQYQMSAVSLGLLVEGKPYLGIVFNPFTNEVFYAQKGKGAFLNGEKIEVTPVKAIDECLVSIGTSPYEKHRADVIFETFKKIFVAAQDIRRSGSAALDLCYVAAGRLGGYLERGLKPWDYMAGVIIIQEAGGLVTDWDNNDISYGEYSDVLATNGNIHSKLIELSK